MRPDIVGEARLVSPLVAWAFVLGGARGRRPRLSGLVRCYELSLQSKGGRPRLTAAGEKLHTGLGSHLN
jgi:hypothetical protein